MLKMDVVKALYTNIMAFIKFKTYSCKFGIMKITFLRNQVTESKRKRIPRLWICTYSVARILFMEFKIRCCTHVQNSVERNNMCGSWKNNICNNRMQALSKN